MEPTITLLIGSPLTGDEARFLRKLHADLKGVEALILANFETPRRQIDFVVVTPAYAALLELKNFPRPIIGHQNGIWTYLNSGGQWLRYAGENPYRQTVGEKFALSDEMLEFQRQNTDVPAPAGRAYFTQFDAFVCIFPEIHPDSDVTPGDHKVVVASYADVIDGVRSKQIHSTWSLVNWKRFAEQHLHLSRTTLDEATCPAIQEASERLLMYRTRLRNVIGTGLPPLFSTRGDASHGHELLDALREPRNFILLGPSGSTKTFHLHHLLLEMAARGDELPLMVEAKRYRGGDFWTVLRHGVAPFYRGDPRELLDGVQSCGLSPVLVVDALNECGEPARKDFLRGIQSFVVQYGGRVIFSSQISMELSGEIAAECKKLVLPTTSHKRAIYAYHAGAPEGPELDQFCLGFTNAYDLTIAGRCHSLAHVPSSRAELYDRYVRRCLPANTATAKALLRLVAHEMAATFSASLNRDEFERIAEEFLSKQNAPLSVIDELRGCRLIQLTEEGFTFEHELLLNYFKADHLRREFKDLSQLTAELRKPRHQDLIEFVLPRFVAAHDLREIFGTSNDVHFLSKVLQGSCGTFTQKELLRQCELLLEEAARDLNNIRVECPSVEGEDGRRRLIGVEVVGHREWDSFTALLCHAIALNIDNPELQSKFLDLLDLTEWSLHAAADQAAKASRFKPARIWSEIVRLYGGILQHGTVTLPCCTILSSLRRIQMFPRHFKSGLPIRDRLFERVSGTPDSDFSMLSLLEDLQHGEDRADVHTKLALIRRASQSGVYILKVEALELLQLMNREVHETAPDELPSIRSMLETFDTDDIMVNTAIIDTLASYDFLEPLVGQEVALSEMKAVIAPGFVRDAIKLASLSEMSPEQFASDCAYGLLSKIFEDVFQGVYYHAYNSLSDDEKRTILCLAANASQQGFFTDWILRELFRYGGEEALPIYRRFAFAPDGESLSPQEAVATFVLGVWGCAKQGTSMRLYSKDESADIQAWQTFGEILFSCFRGSPVSETVWERFVGPVRLATADVLYQLQSSNWKLTEEQRAIDLPSIFPQYIRPIIEECLRHRESLPSIFKYGGSRDAGVVRFLISCLGSIGNAESLSGLSSLADDQSLGKEAIHSIESIQRRLSPIRDSAFRWGQS